MCWEILKGVETLREKFVYLNNGRYQFSGCQEMPLMTRVEDLKFEGFTAELITYGFKKGKFKGVNVLIKDEKLDHLVQIWTEKYGEPKFTDDGFLKNYEWHMDNYLLTISHFPQKSGDANTTIGISIK